MSVFLEIGVYDAVFQSLTRKHLSGVHVEKDGFLYIPLTAHTHAHTLVFVGSSSAQWLKAEFLNSLTCLILYMLYMGESFFVP